jgi:two-component system sensor histidine kinase CpxA
MWFGAVMVTVIIGTFVAGELARRHERIEPPLRRPLDTVVSEYAKNAAEEYDRGGQSALVAYLDRIQSESNLRTFLFNSQLQELSGRRLPPGAQDLAKMVLEKRLPEVGSGGPPPLLARPAFTAGGDQYVLVAEMPRRTPPGLLHPIAHVLAITFLGGFFCYGLARYLTSPVGKLRAATRELASGNLSARVGPALGKRRDELASLGADFDVMAEKIQSLVDSQRRLLGDISHELRSPLARLNVALELARQRSGADATTALERIQREAEILNEMIGQLLALTRLESGAEEIRKAGFDLARLVSDIADDADFEARSRKRSVKLESTESCTIVGNEQLLRRAIENVVRNAVQYTEENTEVNVKLCCQAKQQGDGKGPGNRAAVITVRDHGAGVPENALGEIFRPFYRVDEARDREAGGVGLGLAIADRAVRLHSGRVEAANVDTGGLLVTIILPTEQTADSKQLNKRA